ncbi:MAG: FKBP-type peptidyl-prolyl cis-trans isomerase [Pseudomonadales bacterium]
MSQSDTANESAEQLSVAHGRVVTFHYEMRDADDEVLESSLDGPPQIMLYGYGGVIKGLEEALAGKVAGERLALTLPPEKAFGVRDPQQQQRVSKKHFPKGTKLTPGMVTALQSEQGNRPVTVIKVGRTVIDVDLNHPRAGLTLQLDVQVESVRAATAEERAHGHAHGPGGHQH